MPTFLVAIDFSEASRKMLDVAVNEAKLHQAKIVLVHAFHGALDVAMIYNDRAIDPIGALEQELKLDEAVELTTKWAQIPRDAGLEVETVARSESPDSLIVSVADEMGVDRIIMGRHGHSRVAQLFLGSTSNTVLKKAKVPVLVVPS